MGLGTERATNRRVILHIGELYHCAPSEAGREVMENELSVILPFHSLSLCFSSETLGKFSITQLVLDRTGACSGTLILSVLLSLLFRKLRT